MWSKHKRLIILISAAVILAIVVVVDRMGTSTGTLIDEARSGETSERLAAIDGLGKAGSERAVGAIGDMVEDPNTEVACRAVEVLGRTRRLAVLPRLRAAAEDPRPQVREAGMIALGRLGRKTDPEVLAQALQADPSPEVRAAAARWIGLVRYWEGMPALIQGMNDPSEQVRRDAGAAVRQLWERDFLYRADDPPEKRARVVEFIRQEWEGYQNSPAFQPHKWSSKEKRP